LGWRRRTFSIVKAVISGGSALHHRKFQGAESHILSHDSTHRWAMDKRMAPNERGGQTTSCIKRLDFFEEILVTFGRGK
jgi:hypothetical protein